MLKAKVENSARFCPASLILSMVKYGQFLMQQINLIKKLHLWLFFSNVVFAPINLSNKK
jgi:hypothetical protein